MGIYRRAAATPAQLDKDKALADLQQIAVDACRANPGNPGVEACARAVASADNIALARIIATFYFRQAKTNRPQADLALDVHLRLGALT